ncbi:MAG TPA: hypothetical protein VGJ84_00075 [Polyangiaceae bacterium]|jgi:hypothetical protein
MSSLDLVRLPCWLGAALAALTWLGCESAPKQRVSATDAGSKPQEMDPNLAKAVGAAAPSSPTAERVQVDGGPPSNGIFALGAADREVRKGAPPKMVVGSLGSEPRVPLSPLPETGKKKEATLQVSLKQDPRQPELPFRFKLSFEAKKAAADAPNKGMQISVRVDEVGVALDQSPQARAAAQQLKQLKGSRVDYQLLPDGGGQEYRFQTPPGVPRQMGEVLRNLSDAISTFSLSHPDQVGTGAYWMITSREPIWGLDLVSYRMVRVLSASPAEVSLSLGVRRYATSAAFDTPLLQADTRLTLDEFIANAEGEIKLSPSQFIPTSVRLTSQLAASLIPASNPKQRAMAQAQVRIELPAEPRPQ